MLKLAAVVSGLAFVALGLVARSSAYLPFDPPVSRAVQAVDTPQLRALAEALSWPGFPPQVDVLVGLLAALIFLSGRRWEAAGVAIAGAGAGVLYLLALALVDQPRPSPDLVRVAANLSSSAFPSGHEATLTAVLGFLSYLGARGARLLRAASALGVAVCVVAVGWARLYQGQHWLSELIGGVLLGSCWLAVTILVYQRLSTRAP